MPNIAATFSPAHLCAQPSSNDGIGATSEGGSQSQGGPSSQADYGSQSQGGYGSQQSQPSTQL